MKRIPDYNSEAKCIRCNCSRIAIFHCKDHIERVCRNCFYTWKERCSDFDWLKVRL